MRAKEFWNESVTKKSFEKLLELNRKYRIILIGGWAVYLWTGMHKSKDIDVVVDYDTLLAIRAEYAVEKNERLRKYEIKGEEFDIDLYLPSYSRLALPVETIIKESRMVNGFNVPVPEVLLILKQGAEIERRGSIKGRKDLIDIATLLIHSDFDVKKYRALLKDGKIEHFEEELLNEINEITPKDLAYLGIDLNEFAKWKRGFLKKLKTHGSSE